MKKPIEQQKKIIKMVMEPRMKRLFDNLKNYDEDLYFSLTPEEKKEVSNNIKVLILDETLKVIGEMNDENIIMVIEICIETLIMFLKKFEVLELYSRCQMMTDTIKELRNDFQELDTIKL
jgi:hypothetical protein